MDPSLRTGIFFGLTSGAITTLGLMVGLHSGTNSRTVVIGGILTIAIADAFSDALGIHVSEESEGDHTAKEVWVSTIATFLSKFILAISFLLPVLALPLETAILVSLAWGFSVLGILSYAIGKEQGHPLGTVAEHWGIAAIVVFITHYVGDWISHAFA